MSGGDGPAPPMSPVSRASERQIAFSPVHEGSGCSWSPDGRWLASAVGHRLVVRDGRSLTMIGVHSHPDDSASAITSLEWSPDSSLVLCRRGPPSASAVDVFSSGCGTGEGREDSESESVPDDWRCRIDEGSAGLACARWGQDSRHVLTCCDFRLRVAVWSLVSGQGTPQAQVQWPKTEDLAKGVAFSGTGLAAVLVRKECKDSVAVYNDRTWKRLAEWRPTGCCEDVVGLCFCRIPLDGEGVGNDGQAGPLVCLWGSDCGVSVALYTLEGLLVVKVAADPQLSQSCLGVRRLEHSPDGQTLAVGCTDSSVILASACSGAVIGCLPLPQFVADPSVVVYQESADGRQYLVAQLPITLGDQQQQKLQTGRDTGVSLLRWSADSSLLAVVTKTLPSVVTIWDAVRAQLCSVLVHADAVRGISFSSAGGVLSLWTSSRDQCVRLWSPAGCSRAEIPQSDSDDCPTPSFTRVRWCPSDPRLLALCGDTSFCCVKV